MKVELTTRLGRKISDLDDTEYNEDGSVKTIAANVLWSKDKFLKLTQKEENETDEARNERHKNNAFGLLFANFGQGAFKSTTQTKDDINLKYIFPSASVGYILEKAIARDANIGVEIEKNMLDMLYDRWVPCVTNRLSPNVNMVSSSAVFEFDPLFNEMSLLSIVSGRQYNFFDEKQGTLKIPIGSYDVIFKKSTQSEDIEVFSG